MDISNSTQSDDIPFKIIKDNADIFVNFNKCIIEGKFPDQLKKADASPVFKKRKVSYSCFQKFMSVSFITK